MDQMAPPRRVLRQQLEILLDFLEQNPDMAKGLSPALPASHHKTRQKWSILAKQLNAVETGLLKTPDRWKKYWFEWRHKCKKKAANYARRFQPVPDGSNKYVDLNDLESRALELSGKDYLKSAISASKELHNSFAEDSNPEPLETVKVQSGPTKLEIRRSTRNSRSPLDDDDQIRNVTPPPKWALQLEERRIAAEERMADALQSMAALMKAQEERRGVLEDRIADALSAISGTVQDLNSGVQEAVQHFQQLYPL